jgi:hypothetical protein
MGDVSVAIKMQYLNLYRVKEWIFINAFVFMLKKVPFLKQEFIILKKVLYILHFFLACGAQNCLFQQYLYNIENI